MSAPSPPPPPQPQPQPQTPILLLKSPSPTPSTDPYTTHLTHPPPQPYTPNFIPVLTHTLLPDPLIALLTTHLQPPHPPFPYGALIITSQRAVATLAAALAAPPILPHLSQLRKFSIGLYTVGPATYTSLKVLRDKLLPECTLYGGEGAGSGEVLAGIILGHHDPKRMEGKYTTNSPTAPGRKPVLFLTGEKRRDIIPNTLMNPALDADDRIPVEEMIVYHTTALEEFEFSFARMLRQTETAGVRWVVVFSPTAGKEMLRALGWGDDGGGEGGKGGMLERKTFVACIGPTTREYLESECGFRADAVAKRPSPQGVREGIEQFMRERERGVEASDQAVLP